MSRFHSHDGWFFEREDDGSVIITRRIPIHNGCWDDTDGWPVEYVKLDADTWASAVASVSRHGETRESFDEAFGLHMEGPLPAGPPEPAPDGGGDES